MHILLFRQAHKGLGHSIRCHQVQKAQSPVLREAHRADHVQVLGVVRGPQEVTCGQGGSVPVP